MTMTRFDLIQEPLITIGTDGKQESVSLPRLLEVLSRGERVEFPRLRPHQHHPWYACLTQMAAMALCHAEQGFGPADASQWEELLLRLTDGQREPFCLFAQDLSKPAFFQPPIPEGSLGEFKRRFCMPDELDMLVTSKNHDFKAVKMARPHPEHWLFSLLTLQTMEGFLGAGNYGVVRMNGGFSSRPFVAYAPSLHWGARFCRDMPILMASREKLIDSYGYRESDGKKLLWLDPWDGTSSLELHECDPFFIEICRRVRILMDGDTLCAAGRSTKAARIAQRDRKGDTGDPWTPVERGESPKALSVTGCAVKPRLFRAGI